LQLAALYPDHEHAVVNPTNYQQVQVPVNRSNHQFQQEHMSPDNPHNSSIPYQHLSTAENLNTPCSDRTLHSDGITDEVHLHSARHHNLFVEDIHLSYRPDMTEQLDMEETYYEVCRRNSPPCRNVQMPTDHVVVSGHEGDTVPLQNLAVKVGFGRNYAC
jgi:hypothetical protein